MLPIDKISTVSKISRISYPEAADYNAATKAGQGSNQAQDADTEETRQMKRLGVIECQTCANRTYQDGSDDPGVSFKTPTKLTPAEASTQVPAHEREHFNRESVKAEEENREVLSNSIRIFTAVCKECGKTYVSGGVTTTVTKSKDKDPKKELEALLGLSNEEESPNSVAQIGKGIANKAYGLAFDEKG